MSKVFKAISDTQITIIHGGKTHIISDSEELFNKLMKVINDDSEIIRLVESHSILCDRVTLSDRGTLLVDGQEVSERLAERLRAFKAEGVDLTSLVNFAANLRENPSFRARKMVYDFLEHNGHPTTEDGHFIAYKYVNEDYKDCYTRTMDNSIGAIVEMDRSQVDDDPNNTCSRGLHVASYEYVKNQNNVVLVKVNPRDVVSVPVDYNGTKMRVCRYEVIADCEQERKESTVYEEPVRTEQYSMQREDFDPWEHRDEY